MADSYLTPENADTMQRHSAFLIPLPMSTPEKQVRTDIQALRGLAVLLVVLYHLRIGSAQAGYLGVDVFVVISGFLLTTLIGSAIHAGRFSWSTFYSRRAKRLLPAAYATILLTALAAPWFLGRQELADLASQIGGAVTFSANFVLWRQTGYFAGAGDLKPLLHMWSLAVEEQFYLLLPLAMVWVRPTR